MQWAFKESFETVNLVGARDKELILFQGRWEEISNDVLYSTDDGSLGYHGFVTDLLSTELSSLTNKDLKRTMIFTCGPEAMMVALKKVIEPFHVRTQFSLERFMKCGIGICDSCSMSGKRICMDGPILTEEEVSDLKEFGKMHRDRSGTLIPLKECVR
jgi:dihydroorotate dehydrogenase electron transfer subunit